MSKKENDAFKKKVLNDAIFHFKEWNLHNGLCLIGLFLSLKELEKLENE